MGLDRRHLLATGQVPNRYCAARLASCQQLTVRRIRDPIHSMLMWKRFKRISRCGIPQFHDMQTLDFVLTAWKGESVSLLVGEESRWVGYAQEGAEDVVSVGLPAHVTYR